METERNPGASVEASGKLAPKQEKEVFPTGLRRAVARLENSTEEQQEGTAFAEEKKDAGNSLENDTPAASENAVVQAEKPVQMQLFDDRLLSKSPVFVIGLSGSFSIPTGWWNLTINFISLISMQPMKRCCTSVL